jgi:hypothetical protein
MWSFNYVLIGRDGVVFEVPLCELPSRSRSFAYFNGQVTLLEFQFGVVHIDEEFSFCVF